MALICGVFASRSRQVIACGALRLCAELGVKVRAEEGTAGERDFFGEGVTLIQGYLIAMRAFQARGLVAPVAFASLTASGDGRPAASHSLHLSRSTIFSIGKIDVGLQNAVEVVRQTT